MKAPSLLMLIAFNLMPCSGHAAPSSQVDYSEEADLRFKQGVEAYNRGDYEDAIAHFMVSYRLVPNANVNLNIAFAFEANGDLDQAIHHYFDVAANQPDDETLALANEGIERLRPKCALLNIQTEPEGGEIYIDRKALGSRGQTPHTLALTPGVHKLKLVLPGHTDFDLNEIELQTGKTVSVQHRFQPNGSKVRFVGSPEGAQILIEGQTTPICNLPCESAFVPGSFVFIVQADGFYNARKPYLSKEGKTDEVFFELQPLLGQLNIDANAQGAHVYVDDIDYGELPVHIDAIPVGLHQIRVTHEKADDVVRMVEISQNEVENVPIKLNVITDVSSRSLISEDLLNTPVSMSVISEREIRYFGYESLYEAVVGSRGFYGHREPHFASLGVRGLAFSDNNSRLLVTIDGHRMNNRHIGGSDLDYALMSSLSDVKQIELIRGPSSSIYGMQAVLGTINVQTHDIDQSLNSHIEFASADASGFRARASGKHVDAQKNGFWITGELYHSDGVEWSFQQRSTGNHYEAQDNDSKEAGELALRLKYGALSGSARYIHYWAQNPLAMNGSIVGDTRNTKTKDQAIADLQYEMHLSQNFDARARMALDYYRSLVELPFEQEIGGLQQQEFNNLTHGIQFELQGRTDDNRGQLYLAWEANIDSIADLSVKNEQGTLKNAESSSRGMGLHGGGRWLFFDQLTLGAGGFLLTNSDKETHFSPRFSLNWRPNPDNIFNFYFEKAYRKPNLQEDFLSIQQLSASNEGKLKHESDHKFEIEYTRFLPQDFMVTSSIYFNQLSNAIMIIDQDDPALVNYFYNNPKTIYTLGGDIEIQRDWNRNLFLLANYGVQLSRIGSLTSNSQLLNSPVHLATLKVASPINIAHLVVANRFRFESARKLLDGGETKNAYLWDMILSNDKPIWGILDFSIGINNLLDWTSSISAEPNLDLTETPQLGRTIFIRLRNNL